MFDLPKRYWSDLKRKLAKEGYSELYDKIVQLKFAAADGKYNRALHRDWLCCRVPI